MQLQSLATNPKHIAVVGSGISGLSAAWLLSQRHHVPLFEREDRLGGHTNTVNVEIDGEAVPVAEDGSIGLRKITHKTMFRRGLLRRIWRCVPRL